MYRSAPTDAEWTQSRVAGLPERWTQKFLSAWQARMATDECGANIQLRQLTEALLRVRIPLDASDSTICDAATALANLCLGRAQVFHTVNALRSAMERICQGQGIEPPHEKVKDGPALARMCCPLWWRKKLRRHQGRTVEAAAISLGHVNMHRDLYVSEERLRTRHQQNIRNQTMLESTYLRNELGQEFTLAELAEKSTSSKPIRRAEFMTRVSGFERIAKEEKHVGLFITITCPSRFHPCRTVNRGKKALPNPNYDPAETPRTGQTYLAKVWREIRADLGRRKIQIYGLRVAEPQHDGTPHWHLVLFCRTEDDQTFRGVFRKHALKDTPNERGAALHRCDIKTIDWRKGSAAGYIIKYVAKNLDGFGVGEDLNGKPATETCVRVDAWAATWGIRQFQQIGGPPVSVWRELRRIKTLPIGSPEHLVQAHQAANRMNEIEGKTKPAVSWDLYCKAQGGVFCGRNARIKLSMAEPQGTGQYGDAASPRPFGVETTSMAMHGSEERLVHWIVESTRHVWEFVRRQDSAPVFAKQAMPAEPWTRVNNCTDKHEDEKFDDTFQQVSVQNAGTSFDPEQIITLPQYRSGHT